MPDLTEAVPVTEHEAELIATGMRYAARSLLTLTEADIDTVEAVAVRFTRTANNLYMANTRGDTPC